MAKNQKLTKTICVEVTPSGKDQVVWDSGDGSVKGFGLRVTPGGARSFVLMYRAGRGRAAPLRKLTIGGFGQPWTVELARKEALRLLGEVAAQRDPAAERKAQREAKREADPEPKDTVKLAIAEWLQRDQGRNRSLDEVRRTVNREVLPTWGERSLRSITKRDVITLIDAIADRGAMTMANRVLSHVRRFFNWCAGRDMVDANPAQFVEKPGHTVKRDRVLDDGELVEVWRALEGMGESFAAGVRLLVLTGARRAEIFEAVKDELVPGGIKLPAARSKNEEGRLIHLTPQAQIILNGLKEWPACSYLLTSDGEHPFSGFSKCKADLDQRIAEVRAEAVDATDQEPKPMPAWRLHDVRRSVATGLQRLGVRMEVVEAVMGHVGGSRAGVVGIYQRHRFGAEAREALLLWGEHITRLLDPEHAKVVRMRRGR